MDFEKYEEAESTSLKDQFDMRGTGKREDSSTISGECRHPFLSKHERPEEGQGLGEDSDLSVLPSRCLGDVQVDMSGRLLDLRAWSSGLRSVLEMWLWKSSAHNRVHEIVRSSAQMRGERRDLGKQH